jgi:hypothetical protein
MSPDPHAVQKGQVRLWDRFVPDLTVGTYEFGFRQAVGENPDQPNMKSAGSGDTVPIKITGPRLGLLPADVIATGPAPGEMEALEENVPHIALRRRTLPWEVDVAGDRKKPWMALLLFEGDGEKDTHEFKLLRNQLPLAGLDHEPGERCNLISVRRSLLKEVMPLKEEVPLLAHVRRVNTEDKEAGNDEDGYIAVVVGNRLPRPGGLHRACLVSLEGQWGESFWPEADDFEGTSVVLNPERVNPVWALQPSFPFAPAMTTPSIGSGTGPSSSAFPWATAGDVVSIRPGLERLPGLGHHGVLAEPEHKLVLLHSWTFTAGKAGSFEERMEALDVDAFGARATDSSGTVQLEHCTRDGTPVVSLYRSPLSGVQRQATGLLSRHPDRARALDEDLNEDVSYAAAFEIGRLLALSDPGILSLLIRYRRDWVLERFSRGVNLAAVLKNLQDLERLLDPRLDLLGKLVDELVRPPGVGPPPLIYPPDIPVWDTDPSGIDPLLGRVPGLDDDIVQRVKGSAAVLDVNPGRSIDPATLLEGLVGTMAGRTTFFDLDDAATFSEFENTYSVLRERLRDIGP